MVQETFLKDSLKNKKMMITDDCAMKRFYDLLCNEL